MKKIIVIITAVVLALILAFVLTMKKIENNSTETIEDVQTIEDLNNEKSDVSDNLTVNEEEVLYQEKISDRSKKQDVIKSVSPKNNSVCTDAKETIKKEFTNAQNDIDSRKFTSEEEELLKKIPRSSEVVVDKEIKVKSSRKYFFR